MLRSRSQLALPLLWLSLASCAGEGARRPPPSTPEPVVVNLERAPKDAVRLPEQGRNTAPVTIVALIALDDPESAAMYQTLLEQQQLRGGDQLRLVLVTGCDGRSPSPAESLATRVFEARGDAAYFDFVSRVFETEAVSFGQALALALEVSRAAGSDGSQASDRRSDKSAPVVQAEAESLSSSAEPEVPSLSLNGIRVLGRLAPARFDALLGDELEAATALVRSGVPQDAVYPERVSDNANRVVRAVGSTSFDMTGQFELRGSSAMAMGQPR